MIRTQIDLTEACAYVEGEHDKLIKAELKKVGLLSCSYVYNIFNHMRADQVEQTGRVMAPGENVFYAFKRPELVWDNGHPNCLKICTKQYLEPGIAIFDIMQLEEAYEANSKFGYSFKDKSKARDALKGIVELFIE